MTVNLLTIKDIRRFLSSELEKIYEPHELEPLTRIIIDAVAGNIPGYLRYDQRTEIDTEAGKKIIAIAERLKKGEPYQYVLGETEFCGCTIRVSPAVLIPRPETELLADLIIKENSGFRGRIVDFGTGSGCIAIALAKHLKGSHVTAIDNSADALAIASANALINNVELSFLNMDILDREFALRFGAGIIVSNPPYVMKSEKVKMQGNVIDHEPHAALFVDDDDPLIFYRAIAGICAEALEPEGKLYFEINESMGTKIEVLLKTMGFSDIMTLKDLNKKDRIIKATKNG